MMLADDDQLIKVVAKCRGSDHTKCCRDPKDEAVTHADALRLTRAHDYGISRQNFARSLALAYWLTMKTVPQPTSHPVLPPKVVVP